SPNDPAWPPVPPTFEACAHVVGTLRIRRLLSGDVPRPHAAKAPGGTYVARPTLGADLGAAGGAWHEGLSQGPHS
ncbi:MAG: hypothetical protein ACE5I7_20035, partial [Candidatus Binatia bacterium]